jgi:hypothetical protein
VHTYNWVGSTVSTGGGVELIIPTSDSAAKSELEGDLLIKMNNGSLTYDANSSADVNTTLYMIAKDEAGILSTTGGSEVFVHIEEHCLVTSNFKCDLKPNRP